MRSLMSLLSKNSLTTVWFSASDTATMRSLRNDAAITEMKRVSKDERLPDPQA